MNKTFVINKLFDLLPVRVRLLPARVRLLPARVRLLPALVWLHAARIRNDRDGIHRSITYANLLTTLPFSNSVEKLKISGATLKKVLEHSVEGYDPVERPGAFMQYSGMRVHYDLTKPPGERVVKAEVRCGDCRVPAYYPLDLNKEYQVVTTSYLADGGDNYQMFKEAKTRKVLSFTDVDAVETYLMKKSPVNPEIGGRIMMDGDASGVPALSPGVLAPLLCLVAVKMLSDSYLDR